MQAGPFVPGDEVVCIAGPKSILSQLAIIRADLSDDPCATCRIETAAYRCANIDGIDQFMRDIRARRLRQFRIDERRWGRQRIVVNYFGQ